MKADNPAKHFIITFAIAAALYAVSYSWIEHRRNRKGPWEISFTNSPAGPLMVINQLSLGLTNVEIVFPGEAPATNQGVLVFREPRSVPFAVPFGACVFEDLTFLPGTVTVQVFKHEIELLPRVLVIDQKERAWSSGSVRLEKNASN